MANDFDSSDILGSSVPLGRGRAESSSSSSFFFLGFLAFAGVGVYFWFKLQGHVHYARWRERKRRRAARERYGIEADDTRPFAVAYAQARKQRDQARLDRERASHSAYSSGRDETPPHLPQLRNRLTSVSPGVQYNYRPSAYRDVSIDRYQNLAPPEALIQLPAEVPVESVDDYPETEEATEEATDEPSRSSPVSQGDHDSGFGEEEGTPAVMEGIVEHGARRAKRLADSGEEGDLESLQGRRHDKRRRKTSNRTPTHPPIEIVPSTADEGEEMEVDAIDEMPAVRRGKKRDRVEAGSTFGGDDESAVDDVNDERSLHRRKRRNRRDGASHRGRKRGRGVDTSESESEEGSRRIAGKASRRRQHYSDDSEEDVPVDGVQVHKDPRCGGRRVGEEWEAPGAKYKVGRDGRRLILALVKANRPLFPMPNDSQHPDRKVNVNALVEKWLTDEEYQLAKDRRELAWQDPPPSITIPAHPSIIDDRPSFWKSTSGLGASVRRQSLLASPASSTRSLNLELSPSPQPTPESSPRRRISSFPSLSSMGKSKSLSKWQKQELEATSMDRIRAKNEAELAKREQSKPKVSSPLATVPPTSSIPASAPSLTFQKAPEDPSAGATAPAVLSEKKDEAKQNESSKSTFAFPSLPAKPEEKENSQSSAPAPSLSFSAPNSAQPAKNTPTSSAPTSANIPNFFGNKGSQTPAAALTFQPTPAQSTAAPANPSPLGLTAQSSSQTAPAPSFSFGPPKPAQTTSANVGERTEEPKSAFPFGRPGPTPVTQPSTSEPTSQPSATNSTMFSFSKPAGSSAAASSAPSSTPAAGASADSAAKPKFSFGIGKPSSLSPPAASSAPAAPSTYQDSAPKFSFGPTAGGAGAGQAPMTGTSPSPAAPANPFAFGASNAPKAPAATPSLFANNAGAKPEANKAAFSFGPSGGANSGQFTFGGASNNTTNAPPAGASSPSFASKPAFSFGASGTQPPAPAPAAASSPFTFGMPPAQANASNAGAASEAPKPSGGFNFAFGAQNNSPFAAAGNSQSNANAPTGAPPAAPSFGAPSGAAPNPFGFGSGSSNSGAFSFGPKK